MKGDNDMALDDMIQFLYTGEEPLDFKHTNIWHSWWTTIEMAIVADKYEVDDLLQPALEALKTIPDDTDFALRLAQMKRVAKRFPTEPAKRDQIIFNLGNVEFVESFLRRKRFRTWLDDCCPRVRDRLFIEHIAQLTMQGKFIAMLCKWESHQLVAFFQRGIARFAEGREDVEYLDEEDIDEDKDWDYGRWSGDEEEDSEDEDCENEEDENEKEQADGEVAEGEVEEEEKREAEGEGVVITVVHSDSGADAVEGC